VPQKNTEHNQEKQAAPGAACRKKKAKEKAVALARSRQASSLPAL